MMKPWIGALAIAAAVSLTAGGSQAKTLGEEIAALSKVGTGVTPVGRDSFAHVTVAMHGGVTGLPDVTYSRLNGYRPLKLDLFLPPSRYKSAGPRPLVIYIHGGGFFTGGPRRSAAYLDWPADLALLAEHGYVVASLRYRFDSEAKYPAQIQDVKSAIRWLRVNAREYNIDKNRAVVWGQSAGGQLAGLAAVTCGVTALAPAPRKAAPEHPVAETQESAPEGFDEASDCVQGAVVWFGVFDLSKLNSGGGGRMTSTLLGCEGPCSEDKLRSASAVTYVDAKDPPVLIMHGGADTTVPIQQSEEFYQALKAKGVPVQFVVEPGVGHSWLGKPAATKAASYDAMKRTIDFIQATIGDRRPAAH